MPNNDAVIQLRGMISAAFPNSLALSHSDCEELRTKLVSLHDADVLSVLGSVLIDLAETHTKSLATPDWADSVVRFLSAASPPPLAPVRGGCINANELSEYSASRRPEAEELFRKFTIEQSRAIYRWLETVQSWKESHIPPDELAAALHYWKEKGGSR